MSEFLNKVSEEGVNASLRAWILASVGEMDRIVDDGFPKIFGKEWREKMKGFPVAARTKLLTYVFDYALEEMAIRQAIDYRPANNEGPAETNNFDCYLFDYEVENKLSLGKSDGSFATGSSHNTEKKVSRILAVKVRSEEYRSKKVFAGIIDLSDAQSEHTKWHAGDAAKAGFSALKIALTDKHVVVPLCGNVRSGKKYILSDFEAIRVGGK